MRYLALILVVCPWTLFGVDRTVEFNRDVLPILSDKCFHCHGPDAVAKKIPLRLDSEEAAKKVIVAGNPGASEMVRRIASQNKSTLMPPVYSGLKLAPAEVETLRTWIAQGARWQQHWSFIRPTRPALPPVKNVAWSRDPIDLFVLARLEREGLGPSPEANRETLLRRVTLDLTGLPPTLAEVDAFLKDSSANAYEKVVDRLLASPRYGERMAARWLDAARYADSNGYQYDGERYMWRWRDWVISSFNRNQRFDQFALEQIAGDMLPNATTDQKIATGFNRNHRANTEDGIIFEEYAVEYVVDRVETVSTVFLGLTLGCARCHNHKYDPFTQKEFYQFFSYFNNVPESGRAMKYGNSPPLVAAPTAEQRRALADVDRRIQAVEGSLQRQSPAIDRSQKKWESSIVQSGPLYWSPTRGLKAAFPFENAEGKLPLKPGRIGQAGSFDGKAYLDAGNAGDFDIDDRFSFSAWIYSESALDGSILSRMTDTEKGKGYGIYVNRGKVHVHLTNSYAEDAIRLDTEDTLAAHSWHHVSVTYTGSRMAEGIRVYLDGKLAKVKVEQENLYRPFRNAGKSFKEPFRIGAGGGPKNRFRGLIDDVRIYERVLNQEEISALALGVSLNDIARKPSSARTEIERTALRWYFLENAAPRQIEDSWKQLTSLHEEKQTLERTFSTVMVMAERDTPRDTFLLVRGAYNQPGEKVQPGIPVVLTSVPAAPAKNRLEFGKWVIDPRNPLLARVTMNRFWQMYFGTGIVKTTEDFGRQGEWPSHPELLDWLATEFVRSGWDTKAMQKSIVMSRTYRQSSKVTPELVQKDPENKLLARGPRNRLPAEMIRDQALAIAGLLSAKVGGPSVKPYQPAGLWKELSMQDMDYVQSKGEDLYRRGLYTFWKRTIAPPMMANFDSAMRESCVVRETRTNTPLQALNLMNDVTFLEASRFLGQRMMKEGGADPASRLKYGFRLATGRAPSQGEEQVVRDNFQFHLDYFSGKAEETKAFLGMGDSPADPTLDRRQLAAYASVGSLLLNLDEVVTKE